MMNLAEAQAAFVQDVLTFTKDAFREVQAVYPTAVLLLPKDGDSKDYRVTFFTVDEIGAKTKDDFCATIRTIAARTRAVCVCLLVEAWMVADLPPGTASTVVPKDHPDRKEVVIVLIEYLGRSQPEMYRADIVREGETASLLEFKQAEQFTKAAGRFIGLLPVQN